MVLLTHPFGNANVRGVLSALDRADLLARYVTAVGWSKDSPLVRELPEDFRSKMARRAYDLPHYKIKVHPTREILRLLAGRLGQEWLTEHEHGSASIDQVWRGLDKFAAKYLRDTHRRLHVKAVYAYEDCAANLFETSQELGIRRIYDLPIAYWETSRRLLQEEAQRYPDWEPTLLGTRDSQEKLARKSREIDLAEIVICPSAFVRDSLPKRTVDSKLCVVIPFGSPSAEPDVRPEASGDNRPLRILFAGTLTQRKGLADLFAAVRLVASKKIELVVMGTTLRPLGWYREQLADFTYERPRPNAEVLQLMRTCDVFVLPSIVEGRALVQQEAMACGLPLIVTKNAGADDLIDEGKTGFLVPIRSPKAIAEKIEWFVRNRSALDGMRIAAQTRASELTWFGYGEKVLAAIRSFTAE